MGVIAELLHRQCNAAVPHIDVGNDVFAFRDGREEVARIQVKTGAGERYAKSDGFSAKFGVPIKQLKLTDSPPIFYALAVRLDGRWAAFLIIGRAVLNDLWVEGLGSVNAKSGDLELHVQFRWEVAEGAPEKRLTAKCGTEKTRVYDLSAYLNAWEGLPPLKPQAPIAPGEVTGGAAVKDVSDGQL